MEFTIFKPEYFINAITNKKFNPNKIYTQKMLVSMTPKEFKPVIKNILMLDNAFSKVININAYEIANKFDLPNLFNDANADAKKVWAEFVISYQNALKPELIKLNNTINELKQNLGQKANNKKFEILLFYKNNLEALINTSFEDLSSLAFNKTVEQSGEKPELLTKLANLYRHAKEYERLKNMYYYIDTSRGIQYNKSSLHDLLKEIADNNQKSPALDEIKKLYYLILDNKTNLGYNNKKLKKESITVKDYISVLDNAYLNKINIMKYIEVYYINKVNKIHKDELSKISDPAQKINFLRNEFVNLTRNSGEMANKLREIFHELDQSFFGFAIEDDNKIHQHIPNQQVKNSEQNICHLIDNLNQEFRDELQNLLIEVKGQISLTPFKDKHLYSVNEFFYNSEEIVDNLFNKNSDSTTTKSNDTLSSKNNDLKDEIVNSVAITQKNDDLPTVDPNLSLDKKIDAYFEGLIGLNEVKETLLEVIAKKLLEGKNYKQGQMHMAFLGNPGTGKTTVARITGRILYENGLINSDKVVECKFSDLYQNYVGFSAKATQEKIKEAEGGILFIDEAHQLATTDGSSKDFRKEIINVLVPELENNKNLLVVFAGYSKEMLDMLTGSDKGLFSRVSHRITFKDFSREDISKLFKLEMSKKKNRNDENFILTSEAEAYVEEYFDLLIKSRNDNFANGREVRVAVNKILNRFGVIALNREDIKTIDGPTMKEILTSYSFENDILTANEENEEIKQAWLTFKNSSLQPETICYA